tara:strand:+ start:352 stop:570 length:219 start_codon:yes stop_codon:yes gene_type:complete
MRYTRQTQAALDRLDQSLMRLRDLIKRGQNQEAIRFMEEGELKERFGDLQSIITVASVGNLGAGGVNNVGNL